MNFLNSLGGRGAKERHPIFPKNWWAMLVLVLGIISVISVCAVHCGLVDSPEDNFHDRLINIVGKLGDSRRLQWSLWK